VEEEERVVKHIIEEALKSWEYALDTAEYIIKTYKEKEEFGDLFVALVDAIQVINDTSSGSIYYTLMEMYHLSSRYENNFIQLWARAKELRVLAQNEINNLFLKEKRI
jgi:galactitol-specific phosphotransferase system IIB component